MDNKPLFIHDNDKSDLQNMVKRALDDPNSVTMKDMERAADDHVRGVAKQYQDKSVEDIARESGQGEIIRSSAHSHLFVSSKDITEIWEIKLTEMQMVGAFKMFELAGGEAVVNHLLKNSILATPHKMLFQKFRQMHGGKDQLDRIRIFIFWSDVKLDDGQEVIIRTRYHEGLKRVPVYEVPSYELMATRGA